MELSDVLTLAKAGFSAAQISALAAVQPKAQNPEPTPAPAPAPAPTPGADKFDEVLKQLGILNQTVQGNAINGASMPKEESVGDILASIINPPDIVGGKE